MGGKTASHGGRVGEGCSAGMRTCSAKVCTHGERTWPFTSTQTFLSRTIGHPLESERTSKEGADFGCFQMIGDVWEWTSSEYGLYPRFKSKFSEYTDKWSVNQKVLRGGSFATPWLQIRNTYRNYFRPNERILFSGFRCAADP